GLAVLLQVRGRGADDPPGVALHLVARLSPRGDAVPAQDAAHRIRIRALDVADVESELEAGPAPRHPHDLAAVDALGELGAVRRGGDGDAGVGMQVVDVRLLDEGVHRGVDGRRRTTF